jgi:hypothetical protein
LGAESGEFGELGQRCDMVIKMHYDNFLAEHEHYEREYKRIDEGARLRKQCDKLHRDLDMLELHLMAAKAAAHRRTREAAPYTDPELRRRQSANGLIYKVSGYPVNSPPAPYVAPHEMTLRSAYSFLALTEPFCDWRLPDAGDIEFRILDNDDKRGGWYDLKNGRHTIAISSRRIGQTRDLIKTMAHEMIHMFQFRGNEAGIHDREQWHNKQFQQLARQVRAHHGFDP